MTYPARPPDARCEVLRAGCNAPDKPRWLRREGHTVAARRLILASVVCLHAMFDIHLAPRIVWFFRQCKDARPK